MLHDVAGRTRLPYINKEIFLASPLVYNIHAGNVTFQLPANMILQNNSYTLSTLNIDLGGGQIFNLSPGGSATVQLQQTGTVNILITATFSNGTQKKIYASIEVESQGYSNMPSARTTSPPPEIDPCNLVPQTIDADISFQDYNTPTRGASLVAEVCELAILVPACNRDLYIYL
jgi:hypothetical protein